MEHSWRPITTNSIFVYRVVELMERANTTTFEDLDSPQLASAQWRRARGVGETYPAGQV